MVAASFCVRRLYMSFLLLELPDRSEIERLREVLTSAGFGDVRIRDMKHMFPGQARIGGMTAAYGERSSSGPCDIFVVTRACGVEAPRRGPVPPSDYLVP